MSSTLIELSSQLLLAVKKSEPTIELEKSLAIQSSHSLFDTLIDDTAKKVFWINIYNAYYQLLATKNIPKEKGIYKWKNIPIAGNIFSLDEIEHGILRKYRWKWSLGYLPNLFVNRTIKKLSVHKMDYRIHFALNCGAKSCPPISFYDVIKLDGQLNLAMYNFVESETQIDDEKKTISTSRLFEWFIGDFGGKSGVMKVLKTVFEKDLAGYKLVYSSYDWSPNLQNFS